ncbi:hypothetical protein EYF80_002288 [Liparis tanakae]|uniref:Uncharacterized protein n=1 Tax=Liparis tanakae TaxID=230148 RepID=A0A4Z2JC28_9TELE|nr:hypothetical protein EYF80_002288 [Liparis tanakae]
MERDKRHERPAMVPRPGDFLSAPLRDAYRQNDMPQLNGSLRLPRPAAGSSHRSAVRSAVSHEPEEPYMAREPGVHDTEVKVKYLKGALQGKSYIVSL